MTSHKPLYHNRPRKAVIHSTLIILTASLLGAISLWLILPGRNWPSTRQRRIALGAVLGMSCLGLYVSQLPGMDGLATCLIYYPLAGIALFAATAVVSSRNLVHSAGWFALLLLGVSGLFLLQGVPWLAVVNVAVHAVAFYMLFQIVFPEAKAHNRVAFDFTSHEPLLSAAVGAIVVGVLATAIENTPIDKSALDHNCLVFGAMLFGIGLVGFITRRNMILMLLSIEIIFQGISLSLVAWSSCHDDFSGQTMVALILLASGCEATVGLTAIRSLLRRRGRLDIMPWQPQGEKQTMPTGRQDG